MDIRKNLVIISATLGLSSSAYQLEAASLAELQERFAAYGVTLRGELGEQARAIHQELAFCARVEERDPWNLFETEMLRRYPFFKECTGPTGINFPLQVPSGTPVFTKSQWRVRCGPILLDRLEKIKNLAKAEDIPTGLREELQGFLQDATAFIQALHEGNQRVLREEKEEREKQRKPFNPEEYTAGIPDDLKEVAIHLQNTERDTSGFWMEEEMREKHKQFIKWNINQPLIPYLPDEADREQFFETSRNLQAEVVRGLQ
ncbi:MAG: hypothetical protein LBD54_01900 [Puniceicoccales bacterium]|nr:hypothetical protein [Puniceicoccales bacterium]